MPWRARPTRLSFVQQTRVRRTILNGQLRKVETVTAWPELPTDSIQDPHGQGMHSDRFNN